MGGPRAFTAKISTIVLMSMLAPLMPGNRSRWNTACDEGTVNIAGFWITERRALPSDGRFLGYIGSCLDITERKQAQERFRLARGSFAQRHRPGQRGGPHRAGERLSSKNCSVMNVRSSSGRP